jgi:hypothetical protein
MPAIVRLNGPTALSSGRVCIFPSNHPPAIPPLSMPCVHKIQRSGGIDRRTVSPCDRLLLRARSFSRRADRFLNRGHTCDRGAKIPEPYNRPSSCRSAHSPSIIGYGRGLHAAPRGLDNTRSLERRSHGSLDRAEYSVASPRSCDALPWWQPRAWRHPVFATLSMKPQSPVAKHRLSQMFFCLGLA